jgi:hypothetical protein
MRCVASIVFLVPVCSVGLAQSELYGPNSFPQFRDMGGLCGNGFGINRDGRIDIAGASSLSTPLAYVLGSNQLAFGLSGRSQDRRFRWINTSTTSQVESTDATAQAIFGWDTSIGRFSYSHMVVSAFFDSVINFQYQPNLDLGKLSLGAGVQNYADRPHNAGDTFAEDQNNSRSFYMVGTYELGGGNYVSLGKGDVRFKGLFGSGNYQFAKNFKAVVEYDTFAWNTGILYGSTLPGQSKAPRPLKGFIGAYLIGGKFATWTLNLGF